MRPAQDLRGRGDVTPGQRLSDERRRPGGLATGQVESLDGERVNATLLDDYIVNGDGTNSWCQTCGGVVVVRLIW